MVVEQQQYVGIILINGYYSIELGVFINFLKTLNISLGGLVQLAETYTKRHSDIFIIHLGIAFEPHGNHIAINPKKNIPRKSIFSRGRLSLYNDYK